MVLRVTRKQLACGAAVASLGLVMGLPAGDLSAATAPVKQVVTGPIATYWISTTTSSGMTLGGMSGGGKPSMGSIMSGLMGGGNGVSHTMHLQLGSSQAAAGEATGDHLPPTVLDAGNDLPLYYKPPKTTTSQPTTYEERDEPQDYQPPKGKILIFWGCGQHAPKGQPVVIDLAKIADPTQRMATMKQFTAGKNLVLDDVHAPSPQTSKSYGEWPNEKTKKGLTGNSSLLGSHTVKANYAPQINFTVDKSQDFLAPINITKNAKDGDGAVVLIWDAIPASKGFFATAMGGGQDTVVMWTSSQIQTSTMGMAPDYLTAGDIDRLQSQKVLLPGSATTCTVPAEVASAGEGQFFGLTAYGGDANFSYPARPEDPKVPWNIQWTAKVRYKSTTGGILGTPMPSGGGMGAWSGMGGGGDEDAQSESSSSSSEAAKDDKKDKKKKNSMFGDLVKQAAGSLIPGM